MRRRHVFVDRVDWASVWPVLGHARRARSIWFFDAAGAGPIGLLDAARRAGWTRASVRRVDAHVGMIRRSDGASAYPDLLEEVRALVEHVRRQCLRAHPLIRGLASHWDPAAVEFHFAKAAERELRQGYLALAMARWMLTERLGAHLHEGVLLTRRGRWSRWLCDEAERIGLSWRGYYAAAGWMHMWGRARQLAGRLGQRLRRAPQGRRPASGPAWPAARAPQAGPVIAVQYAFGELPSERTARTELFWLHDAPDSAGVLLYDYRGAGPMTEPVRQALAARRIRVIGTGDGAEAWVPGRRCWALAARSMGRVLGAAARCALRGRRVRGCDVVAMCELAWSAAYWQDFYAAHGVAVSIANPHPHVGQVLGLEAAGGVAVGYQHSVSNVIFPTMQLSSAEHLQAVCSPLFESVWRRLDPPTSRYVHTGMLADGCLDGRADADARVREARRRLAEAGARCIVAFFDENSADQWDIPAPHGEAAEDYAALLAWLRDAPALGLVLKPKRAHNLRERLGPAARLLDQALATGRCLLMDSDTMHGSVFPAEAARIADVSVGKLAGTTAALEARLAGCRAVLIDTEGFGQHPFYAWGRGRVVFERWADLRRGVDAFAADPQAHPAFGDWSPGIAAMDSFCDGQGAVRFSRCVWDLARALAGGATRAEALSVAAAGGLAAAPARGPRAGAERPVTAGEGGWS